MPKLTDSTTIRWSIKEKDLRGETRPGVGVYTRDEDLTLDAADTWQTVGLLDTQESPGDFFKRENGNIECNVNGFVFVSAKVRFAFTGSGNPTISARIRATVNGEVVPWLIDGGARERGSAEVTTLDFAHPVEVHEGDIIRLQARVSNTDLIIADCPDSDAVCAARMSLHVVSEDP